MPTFDSLSRTATTLGIPISWLKREAEAGRVPCLRAGRRFLFDIEAVAKTLSERSAAETTAVEQMEVSHR